MESLEGANALAKQVLNGSHSSEHGLWVEYAAYCAELFGLQMAYGLVTLSVL